MVISNPRPFLKNTMVKKKLHHGEVRENTTVPVPLHHGAVKTPPWCRENFTQEQKASTMGE